jgi:CheY-like chemotaxis protein
MNILCVDKNDVILALYEQYLEENHNVVICNNMEDAIKELENPYDVFISGFIFNESNGVDFLETAKMKYPSSRCYLLTNFYKDEIFKEDNDFLSKIDKYMRKPIYMEELEDLINKNHKDKEIMKKFTENEINIIFEIINSNKPYTLKYESNYFPLSKDMIVSSCSFEGEENLFSLVGYNVKCVTDGDHRNDGQLVDYEFGFKSPEGDETEIYTEMCLMVGWNHCDDVEIK